MKVREDTITELTATDVTKLGDWPTHASVEKTRKYLTKKSRPQSKQDVTRSRLECGLGTPHRSCWRKNTKEGLIKPNPSNCQILGPSSRQSNPKRMTRPSMERQRQWKLPKWKRCLKRDGNIMRSTLVSKMRWNNSSSKPTHFFGSKKSRTTYSNSLSRVRKRYLTIWSHSAWR